VLGVAELQRRSLLETPPGIRCVVVQKMIGRDGRAREPATISRRSVEIISSLISTGRAPTRRITDSVLGKI